MSSYKKMIADLFFWAQIICATIFCGAYALRSVSDVTGSSVIQFLLVAAFLVFHLILALGAHRAEPSRLTRQAIATYVVWLVLITAMVVAAWTNPTYRWNEKDTTTLIVAVVLTLVTVALSLMSGKSFKDPMVKACFAIAYKSVPQVLLAWKFLAEGASGTPLVSIVFGHVTIALRLGQLYFLHKEAGAERNRTWLAISEVINELSWIVATIAWIIVM